MVDNRKISLCIPTYNRVDMTLQAFENVYQDERISEIIIVDDASDWGVFMELKEFCELIPKIKLYRNLTNQDCYRNKMTALSYATNDWCILLDSDNVIDKSYLDIIFSFADWYEKQVYTPSFAAPTFDFRNFSRLEIDSKNVAEYIDKPLFETMLNAANFFVNKNEYLKCWDGKIDPVTSDSIYFILNWLQNGNLVFVVPDLQYEHRVHSGSHYQNNVARTPNGFHENILQQLRNMK